jgi:hypothetical protein
LSTQEPEIVIINAETMSKKEVKRVSSYLAEAIAAAHNSPTGKFVGAIIIGEPRKGKSSYALKVMRDVYLILNPQLTEEEAYEMALQSLYFKIDKFLDLVLRKQDEIEEMARIGKMDWTQRIPVATLDDASLYAGVDLFFRDQRLYSAFQGTMTTIGTAVSGILITAPTDEALTKCLREYYNYYIVSITEFDQYRREATIREWYQKNDYQWRKRKRKEGSLDRFNVLLPDKIYSKYLLGRVHQGKEAIKELMVAIKEGKVSKLTAAKVLKDVPDFEKIGREIPDGHREELISQVHATKDDKYTWQELLGAGYTEEEATKILRNIKPAQVSP